MGIAWREREKRMPCVGVRHVVLKKASAVASSAGARSNLESCSPAKLIQVGPNRPPEQPPCLFLSLSQLAVRGTTGREANHAWVNRQHDMAPRLMRHSCAITGSDCSVAVTAAPIAMASSAPRPLLCTQNTTKWINTSGETRHYAVRAPRLTSNKSLRAFPNLRRALTRGQGWLCMGMPGHNAFKQTLN